MWSAHFISGHGASKREAEHARRGLHLLANWLLSCLPCGRTDKTIARIGPRQPSEKPGKVGPDPDEAPFAIWRVSCAGAGSTGMNRDGRGLLQSR